MDAANNPPREEQKAYNDDAMAEKMKKQLSENGAEADREEDAGEPVVDYRGWKAMPYVIGNETFEKLGTIGTLSNLLVYLTTVYHIKSVNAATLLSFFSGTSNLAPVLGAFLSDTYLGRYTTLAAASIASFLGMLILMLTAALHSLHPPPCNASKDSSSCRGPSHWQLSALLASFFFLVVGAGGIRPCNLAFGADQFDPRTPSGRQGIASFFNWYYFTFTIAMMLSATLIIYLQSNVNWALGLAVPAALMGLSCALFFMGTRLYVRVRPEGSPFTSFAQVLVAAARKRRLGLPQTPADLFDPPHRSKLISKIAYTDQFRCLDKAAVLTPQDELSPDGRTPANPWRLCTLQQVEEVKCLARIIPVWSSGIVYFVVLSQMGTYVVLQAMQTDRRIGRSGFQVPAGSFVVFQMLALTLWIPVYDRLVVPALRRVTKREGGISLLHRIGVGLALSVATMLVSAAVEQRRRRVGSGMSCFWLVLPPTNQKATSFTQQPNPKPPARSLTFDPEAELGCSGAVLADVQAEEAAGHGEAVRPLPGPRGRRHVRLSSPLLPASRSRARGASPTRAPPAAFALPLRRPSAYRPARRLGYKLGEMGNGEAES